VAGVIHGKPGEPISIPPLGPQRPRNFTVEEQQRVITVLEFELPFALEGVEGRLPLTERFLGNIEAAVGIQTRQKHPEDISSSLGLACLNAPSTGVIVARGDPHGRVNVSAIQFQLHGFVDLANRGALFEQCLEAANRIIERYRIAKHDFRVSRIAKYDILAYGARHRLDGIAYNDWYEPVGPVTLLAASEFPCDPFLRNKMWFRQQVTPKLWERLIAEARHYVAVGENRLAIVTSITALEVVLKDANGRNLKALFDRAGIEFGRLHFRHIKESVSACLGLLNMLASHLHLDRELTERMLEHYVCRNAVMHSGTMRVQEEKAKACVEDTHLLIRHVLDIVHLSVTLRLQLVCLPPNDASFGLLKLTSPEWNFVFSIHNGSLVASLATPSDGAEVRVDVPLCDLNWNTGEEAAILFSYDSRASEAKLAFNTKVVATRSGCQVGSIDASLLNGDSIEMPESYVRPVFPGPYLVHGRVVEPEELAHIDTLFIQPSGD
jgi:hypothetical protein